MLRLLLKDMTLSEKRAAAVQAALIAAGVEESRISSKGYGEDKPIGDNATMKGRAANRRVEFERRVDIKMQ